MGMHSYNFGLKTSGKGEIFESFAVAIGASGAPGTITQCGANLVASVTGGAGASATGTYTVTLNAPLPPKIVAVDVSVTCAAANSAYRNARYKTGSYDPVAGTFVIFVSDATPAAADPASGDSIMVQVTFEQYTTMPS